MKDVETSNNKVRAEINRENESGLIVVEATISLTVFLVVVAAIISLINIFTLTNKVQFSMNAAAHKTAAYSYIYQVLGLRGGEQQMYEDFSSHAQANTDTINQVTDSVNKTGSLVNQFQDVLGSIQGALGDVGNIGNNTSVFGSLTSLGDDYSTIKGKINNIKSDAEGGYASYKQSVSMIKDRFSNLDSTLAGFAYLGINVGSELLKGVIGNAIASWLTKSSFESGNYGSADDFLKAYGVKDGFEGLDFYGSSIFKDLNYSYIDFVVEYDIDLGFAKMILFKPSIHIVQRVTVPAWLNGDGIEIIQNGGEVKRENGMVEMKECETVVKKTMKLQ